MTTLASINTFLEQKVLAVAGVSRNKQKFGNVIFKELGKKEYKLYPVNPNMETYNDETCYADIGSLPGDIGGVVIATNKNSTLKVIQDGEAKGIKNFWVQQGAENKDVIDYAETTDSNVIVKRCILMFAEPVKSIHGVHRFLSKLFRKYPE